MAILKEAHAKVHNLQDRVVLTKRKNGYVVLLQERKGNRWKTFSRSTLKSKRDADEMYKWYVDMYRKNHWSVERKRKSKKKSSRKR